MSDTASMTSTTARFEIAMTPDPEGDLDGALGRFTFTKTWAGGVVGTGRGVMLSAGDPAGGAAGYVAIETFSGSVDGREGTVAFQQFGAMTAGGQRLEYAVVPGSGTGGLVGMTGTVALTIVDGAHEVTLDYALPGAQESASGS